MRNIFGVILLLVSVSSTSVFAQVLSTGYYWWGDKAYFDSTAANSFCMDWNTSTMSCNSGATANYASFLPAAAAEYDNKTDIDAGVGPNGEGKIEFITGHYTQSDDFAAAQPFYGTTPCTALLNRKMSVNGNCNTTNMRPQTAKIYLNDVYLDDQYDPDAQWYHDHAGYEMILHELGHVLGMAHTTTLNSFMEDPLDGTQPDFLHAAEILWIDGVYL